MSGFKKDVDSHTSFGYDSSMNEDELLQDIFGGAPMWRGKYRIRWCELCDTWSASCPNPKCQGSSCNCGGCDECLQDLKDFNSLNPWPVAHLSAADREAVERYHSIKKHLGRCLAKGESLDLKEAKDEGWMSPNEEKLFEGYDQKDID